MLSFCIFFNAGYDSPSDAKSADLRGSIKLKSGLRTYLLHLPNGYSQKKKYPLLIALHGRLGDGKGMARLTHFNQVADSKKFIVVYPDGFQKSWADGRGTTPADKRNLDDVGFIKAMIDKLLTDFSIDSSRIYVAGISNGGFMAQRLACELPRYFSGIAIVSANMTDFLVGTCNPRKGIAALFINGTADPFSPFNGGTTKEGSVISAKASAERWAKFNSCNLEAAGFSLPDNFNDQTSVYVDKYKKCPSNGQVSQFIIKGGGHTWPGGSQYLPVKIVGVTSKEIDASAVIWDFFLGR